MKQPTQVVMLPTKDVTDIIIPTRGIGKGLMHLKEYYGNAFLNMGDEYHHAYVTVSQDVEPIKEGDYVIHRSFGLGQIKDVRGQECFVTISRHVGDGSITTPWKMNIPKIRKIIATNDPKLTIETDVDDRLDVLYDNKIPQVQQSFLKEYVANPDGEFEMEYEYVDGLYSEHGTTRPLLLKINQDNTVNINSVEKKTYSLSDLEKLGDYAYMKAKSTWDWNNWIKENL